MIISSILKYVVELDAGEIMEIPPGGRRASTDVVFLESLVVFESDELLVVVGESVSSLSLSVDFVAVAVSSAEGEAPVVALSAAVSVSESASKDDLYVRILTLGPYIM